ncbi:hypothetical protein BGX26_009184 [Mortierella sp. AD094]|nr:hypothetical protein BGX26_009184 [Mortierella sp. AD094]
MNHLEVKSDSQDSHEQQSGQQQENGQGNSGTDDSTISMEPPTTTPSGAPMPTTTDPTLIESWDRCWALVKVTPSDFDAWEELMRLADRQDGGFTPGAPQANISNVRTIYDAFLNQFPLCFGYWKKYSDLEYLAKGVEGAIEIFERGVKSISNSVDLWVQYCSFVMEHKPDDRDAIERYVQLVASRPLKELISDEMYDKYKVQLTATEDTEQDSDASKEKNQEQLESEMRQLIMEAGSQIHAHTAEETNKRWPFEAEIKRPYFHVKPMDIQQLSNWRRYLDFEEAEGNEERIRVLYERCLVTCALYEEFWLRYGTWARSQDNLEGLRAIYHRATLMVPPSNPSLRLTLALVEEERGDIEAARKQYQTVLEHLDNMFSYQFAATSVPGHIETIIRFANFERRASMDDLSAAENVYASQLGLDNVDEIAQTAIVTLYAKFLWQIKKDIDAARAIFKTGEGKFDSRFYFSTYLKFEMDQPGDDYEKRVSGVFEQVRYSGVPESVKNDFNQSYLDFVMEFGSSAAKYNQLEADIKTPSVYVAESKKRAAAEHVGEERANKQSRQDDVTMDSSAEGPGIAEGQITGAVGHDVDATTYGQQAQWGAQIAPYGYAVGTYPTYATAPVQPTVPWGYASHPGAMDPSGQY